MHFYPRSYESEFLLERATAAGPVFPDLGQKLGPVSWDLVHLSYILFM